MFLKKFGDRIVVWFDRSEFNAANVGHEPADGDERPAATMAWHAHRGSHAGSAPGGMPPRAAGGPNRGRIRCAEKNDGRANHNNRCGIGTLADFVLDLSTRQPELLFDEVLEIAKDAADERRGGLVRRIFDIGGHGLTPQLAR